MSISTLPSGRKRVQYRDSTGKRQSETFDTMAEAKDFDAEVRTRLRSGAVIDKTLSSVTLDEWEADFYVMYAGSLRTSTLVRDRDYYRLHVKPYLGQRSLGSITKTDVQRWVGGMSTGKHLSERGTRLAPRSIDKAYGVLRKLLRSAADHDYIVKAPLPLHPPIPDIVPKPERFLETEEVQALAWACEDRYRAMIYVGCYCGLRIGEICALRIDDIDFAHRRIRVDEGLVEVPGGLEFGPVKTRAGRRWVPAADLVLRELRSHITGTHGWGPDSSRFVFTGPNGGVVRPNNFRSRVFSAAVARAGIKRLTPHDMRHTAAALWISMGRSSFEVAKYLGHTDTRMVDLVYGHLFDTARDQAQVEMSAIADAAEQAWQDKQIADGDNIVALR